MQQQIVMQKSVRKTLKSSDFSQVKSKYFSATIAYTCYIEQCFVSKLLFKKHTYSFNKFINRIIFYNCNCATAKSCTGQLNEVKQTTENKISELTAKRSRLYHKPDAKSEIAYVNKELKELRSRLRMCNNILQDAERINGHYNNVTELEQQSKAASKIIRQERTRIQMSIIHT